jgi:exopolyphosphatase
MIHIPRQDFFLRTEATYAFQRALQHKTTTSTTEATGSEEVIQDLIFMDEIDLPALQQNNDLQLILTDHNKLSPTLAQLSPAVTGILDHHKDEILYLDAEPRVIEVCGSATSLVAEAWETSELAKDGEGERFLGDGELGTLMVSAVLLDTINLNPKFERVTPKDEKAAEFLLGYILKDKAGEDAVDKAHFLNELFEKLQDAKFDCSGLSSLDLLRKDYKETQGTPSFKFGISTVGWYLGGKGGWIEREREHGRGGLEAVKKALGSYATSRGLDVAMIMTAFDHKGVLDSSRKGFERELVVYFPEEIVSRGLDKVFMEKLEAFSDLKLEKVEEHDGEAVDGLYWFKQDNLGMSRKLLQPLVMGICQAML